MLHFLQKGDVIVQSDFNALTGDLQETILDDDNNFLNVPEDYEADEQNVRQSQDAGNINAIYRPKLIRSLHGTKCVYLKHLSGHCHISYD